MNSNLIYYRIKLDSHGVKEDMVPVEQAFEHFSKLKEEMLKAGVSRSAQEFRAVEEHLRNIAPLMAYNKKNFIDVGNVIQNSMVQPLKVLEASLAQTKKMMSDRASSGADAAELAGLQEEAAQLREMIAKRDRNLRNLEYDRLNIVKLSNAALKESIHSAKTLAELESRGSSEQRKALQHMLLMQNEMDKRSGKMGIREAFSLANDEKNSHTIEQLKQSQETIARYRKDFGALFDEARVKSFDAVNENVNRRLRDRAQAIADGSATATFDEMKLAKPFLEAWRGTLTEASKDAEKFLVNGLIDNIDKALKASKEKIAKAPVTLDDADKLMAKSRSKEVEAEKEITAIKAAQIEASKARVELQQEELRHEERLHQIDRERTAEMLRLGKERKKQVAQTEQDVRDAQAESDKYAATRTRAARLSQQRDQAHADGGQAAIGRLNAARDIENIEKQLADTTSRRESAEQRMAQLRATEVEDRQKVVREHERQNSKLEKQKQLFQEAAAQQQAMLDANRRNEQLREEAQRRQVGLQQANLELQRKAEDLRTKKNLPAVSMDNTSDVSADFARTLISTDKEGNAKYQYKGWVGATVETLEKAQQSVERIEGAFRANGKEIPEKVSEWHTLIDSLYTELTSAEKGLPARLAQTGGKMTADVYNQYRKSLTALVAELTGDIATATSGDGSVWGRYNTIDGLFKPVNDSTFNKQSLNGKRTRDIGKTTELVESSADYTALSQNFEQVVKLTTGNLFRTFDPMKELFAALSSGGKIDDFAQRLREKIQAAFDAKQSGGYADGFFDEYIRQLQRIEAMTDEIRHGGKAKQQLAARKQQQEQDLATISRYEDEQQKVNRYQDQLLAKKNEQEQVETRLSAALAEQEKQTARTAEDIKRLEALNADQKDTLRTLGNDRARLTPTSARDYNITRTALSNFQTPDATSWSYVDRLDDYIANATASELAGGQLDALKPRVEEVNRKLQDALFQHFNNVFSSESEEFLRQAQEELNKKLAGSNNFFADVQAIDAFADSLSAHTSGVTHYLSKADAEQVVAQYESVQSQVEEIDRKMAQKRQDIIVTTNNINAMRNAGESAELRTLREQKSQLITDELRLKTAIENTATVSDAAYQAAKKRDASYDADVKAIRSSDKKSKDFFEEARQNIEGQQKALADERDQLIRTNQLRRNDTGTRAEEERKQRDARIKQIQAEREANEQYLLQLDKIQKRGVFAPDANKTALADIDRQVADNNKQLEQATKDFQAADAAVKQFEEDMTRSSSAYSQAVENVNAAKQAVAEQEQVVEQLSRALSEGNVQQVYDEQRKHVAELEKEYKSLTDEIENANALQNQAAADQRSADQLRARIYDRQAYADDTEREALIAKLKEYDDKAADSAKAAAENSSKVDVAEFSQRAAVLKTQLDEAKNFQQQLETAFFQKATDGTLSVIKRRYEFETEQIDSLEKKKEAAAAAEQKRITELRRLQNVSSSDYDEALDVVSKENFRSRYAKVQAEADRMRKDELPGLKSRAQEIKDTLPTVKLFDPDAEAALREELVSIEARIKEINGYEDQWLSRSTAKLRSLQSQREAKEAELKATQQQIEVEKHRAELAKQMTDEEKEKYGNNLAVALSQNKDFEKVWDARVAAAKKAFDEAFAPLNERQKQLESELNGETLDATKAQYDAATQLQGTQAKIDELTQRISDQRKNINDAIDEGAPDFAIEGAEDQLKELQAQLEKLKQTRDDILSGKEMNTGAVSSTAAGINEQITQLKASLRSNLQIVDDWENREQRISDKEKEITAEKEKQKNLQNQINAHRSFQDAANADDGGAQWAKSVQSYIDTLDPASAEAKSLQKSLDSYNESLTAQQRLIRAAEKDVRNLRREESEQIQTLSALQTKLKEYDAVIEKSDEIERSRAKSLSDLEQEMQKAYVAESKLQAAIAARDAALAIDPKSMADAARTEKIAQANAALAKAQQEAAAAGERLASAQQEYDDKMRATGAVSIVELKEMKKHLIENRELESDLTKREEANRRIIDYERRIRELEAAPAYDFDETIAQARELLDRKTEQQLIEQAHADVLAKEVESGNKLLDLKKAETEYAREMLDLDAKQAQQEELNAKHQAQREASRAYRDFQSADEAYRIAHNQADIEAAEKARTESLRVMKEQQDNFLQGQRLIAASAEKTAQANAIRYSYTDKNGREIASGTAVIQEKALQESENSLITSARTLADGFIEVEGSLRSHHLDTLKTELQIREERKAILEKDNQIMQITWNKNKGRMNEPVVVENQQAAYNDVLSDRKQAQNEVARAAIQRLTATQNRLESQITNTQHKSIKIQETQLQIQQTIDLANDIIKNRFGINAVGFSMEDILAKGIDEAFKGLRPKGGNRSQNIELLRELVGDDGRGGKLQQLRESIPQFIQSDINYIQKRLESAKGPEGHLAKMQALSDDDVLALLTKNPEFRLKRETRNLGKLQDRLANDDGTLTKEERKTIESEISQSEKRIERLRTRLAEIKLDPRKVFNETIIASIQQNIESWERQLQLFQDGKYEEAYAMKVDRFRRQQDRVTDAISEQAKVLRANRTEFQKAKEDVVHYSDELEKNEVKRINQVSRIAANGGDTKLVQQQLDRFRQRYYNAAVGTAVDASENNSIYASIDESKRDSYQSRNFLFTGKGEHPNSFFNQMSKQLQALFANAASKADRDFLNGIMQSMNAVMVDMEYKLQRNDVAFRQNDGNAEKRKQIADEYRQILTESNAQMRQLQTVVDTVYQAFRMSNAEAELTVKNEKQQAESISAIIQKRREEGQTIVELSEAETKHYKSYVENQTKYLGGEFQKRNDLAVKYFDRQQQEAELAAKRDAKRQQALTETERQHLDSQIALVNDRSVDQLSDNDLRAKIESRIASQAERMAAVSADIPLNAQLSAQSDWKQFLDKEIASAGEEAKKLEADIRNLPAEIEATRTIVDNFKASAEAQIAEFETKIQTTEQQIADKRMAKVEAQKTGASKEDLDQFNRDIDSLQQEAKGYESEIGKLRSQIDENKRTFENIAGENHRINMEAELAGVNRRIAAMTDASKTAQSEIARLTQAIATAEPTVKLFEKPAERIAADAADSFAKAYQNYLWKLRRVREGELNGLDDAALKKRRDELASAESQVSKSRAFVSDEEASRVIVAKTQWQLDNLMSESTKVVTSVTDNVAKMASIQAQALDPATDDAKKASLVKELDAITEQNAKLKAQKDAYNAIFNEITKINEEAKKTLPDSAAEAQQKLRKSYGASVEKYLRAIKDDTIAPLWDTDKSGAKLTDAQMQDKLNKSAQSLVGSRDAMIKAAEGLSDAELASIEKGKLEGFIKTWQQNVEKLEKEAAAETDLAKKSTLQTRIKGWKDSIAKLNGLLADAENRVAQFGPMVELAVEEAQEQAEASTKKSYGKRLTNEAVRKAIVARNTSYIKQITSEAAGKAYNNMVADAGFKVDEHDFVPANAAKAVQTEFLDKNGVKVAGYVAQSKNNFAIDDKKADEMLAELAETNREAAMRMQSQALQESINFAKGKLAGAEKQMAKYKNISEANDKDVYAREMTQRYTETVEGLREHINTLNSKLGVLQAEMQSAGVAFEIIGNKAAGTTSAKADDKYRKAERERGEKALASVDTHIEYNEARLENAKNVRRHGQYAEDIASIKAQMDAEMKSMEERAKAYNMELSDVQKLKAALHELDEARNSGADAATQEAARQKVIALFINNLEEQIKASDQELNKLDQAAKTARERYDQYVMDNAAKMPKSPGDKGSLTPQEQQHLNDLYSEMQIRQEKADEQRDRMASSRTGMIERIEAYRAEQNELGRLIEQREKLISESEREKAEGDRLIQSYTDASKAVEDYENKLTTLREAAKNRERSERERAEAESKLQEWDATHPQTVVYGQTEQDRRQELQTNLDKAREVYKEADLAYQQAQMAEVATREAGNASVAELKERLTAMQTLREYGRLDADQRRQLIDTITETEQRIKQMNTPRISQQEATDLYVKSQSILNAGNAAEVDSLRQVVEWMGQAAEAEHVTARQREEYLATQQKAQKLMQAQAKEQPTMGMDRINQTIKLGSGALVSDIKEAIASLEAMKNAEGVTAQQASLLNVKIKQLQDTLKNIHTVTKSFSSADALDIFQRTQYSIDQYGKGVDMSVEEVKKLHEEINALANDNTQTLSNHQKAVSLAKQVSDLLNKADNPKALPTMSEGRIDKIIGDGDGAFVSDIKEAIASLEAMAAAEGVTADRAQELRAKIEQLQKTLKGDDTRYDESFVKKTIGNLQTAPIEDVRRALKMVEKQIEKVERGQQEYTNAAARYKQLNDAIQKHNVEIGKTKDRINDANDALENQVDWFTRATSKVASYLGVFGGFYMVRQQLQQAWQENVRYSDSLTNIQKTTQLTAESVKALATELKFLDTRTTIDGLDELAYSAGKLGVKGVADVLGFTRAADQINIALGEQLGQGSEAVEQLYKMVNVLGDVDQFGLEQSLLKIGSAINHLTMNSAATAQPMVNFARRLSGVAKQAGMSSADLMGWAASVNALGQNVELSATSLSKLMVQLSSNSKVVAKALNMTEQETQNFRYDIGTGRMSEALLTVLRKANEAGGLSHLSTIIKELSGSDGQRVVQTLSTLASNYEQVAHMVRMSNAAFEEGVSVTNEYNLKNQNAAALWEKLQKSFSKILVSPENVEWIRNLLYDLQDLPKKFQQILNMLAPLGASIKWLAERVVDFRSVFISIFEGMAVRSIAVFIGRMGVWSTSVIRSFRAIGSEGFKAGVTNSRGWHAAQQSVTKYGIAVDTARGKTATFFAYLKTASFGNMFTVVIAVVMELVNVFIQASTEAKRWKKENEEAMASVRAQSKETEVALNKLLDQYKEAGDSELKRKDIITELNDSYGDYISNLITEKTSYEELAVAIRSANAELRSKALIASRDAQLQKIEDDNAKPLTDRLNVAIKDILDLLPTKDSKGKKIERTPEELQALAGAVEAGILNVTKSQENLNKLVTATDDGKDEFGRPGKYNMFGTPVGYDRIYQDGAFWGTAEGRALLNSQFGFLGIDFEKWENKDKTQDIIKYMLPYINQLAVKANQREDTMRSFNAHVNASNDEIFKDKDGNDVNAVGYVVSLINDSLSKVRASIEGADFKFTRYKADDELVKQGIRKEGEAHDYFGKEQDKYYYRVKEGFGNTLLGNKQRNDLEEELKNFIEDARRGIEILKPRRSGETDPEKYTDIDKKYQELNYLLQSAEQEYRIMTLGNLEDKPDKTKINEQKKSADDAYKAIVDKIRDFYNRQELEIKRRRYEGEYSPEFADKQLRQNTIWLNESLAAAINRILGKTTAEEWAQAVEKLASRNFEGYKYGQEKADDIRDVGDVRSIGEVFGATRKHIIQTATVSTEAATSAITEAGEEITEKAVEAVETQTIAVTKDVLSHADDIRKAMDYFIKELGLTVEQAAGFIGPLYAESRLNPQAVNKAEKEGTFAGSSANGAGYGAGIPQWSKSRKKHILEHLQKQTGQYLNAIEDYNFDQQLEAIVWEMKEDRDFALELLRQQTDSTAAADIVLRGYENGGKTALASREAIDKYTWNDFGLGGYHGSMYGGTRKNKKGQDVKHYGRAEYAAMAQAIYSGASEMLYVTNASTTKELSNESMQALAETNAFFDELQNAVEEYNLNIKDEMYKTVQEVSKAWLEQNPLGKISRQFATEFQTLGIMLNDLRGDSLTNLEQLTQEVMQAYLEIGNNISKYDINRLATANQKSGLDEFREYLKKFPLLAEKAAGATEMQLRGIYYKSYEYAEQYAEQMQRLTDRTMRYWTKMFDASDSHKAFISLQNDIANIQKKFSELEPFGLSKFVNADVNVQAKTQKYQDALARLQSMAEKATSHKAAADALKVGTEYQDANGNMVAVSAEYKKAELASANAELKALEAEGEAVLQIYGEVIDAQQAVREQTWEWMKDMKDAFEKFMDGFVPFRSWYEQKGSFTENVFGTKEERQKAFGEFMDSIKKAVRESAIEQAKLAMARWWNLPELAGKAAEKDKKKGKDDVDNALAKSREMIDTEALKANKDAELEIIKASNLKKEEELQRHIDEENRIKGVDSEGNPVDDQAQEAEPEKEFKASQIESDLSQQQMSADATLAIQQQMEESKQRLVEKGLGKILDAKKKRAKDEQKLDKSTSDLKVKSEQRANKDVEKTDEDLSDTQQDLARVTGNVLSQVSSETAEKEKADNIESSTVSMWGSFGEAIAKAWAQGGPYLGPVLAAVVSAALGSVMTMVFNMIGGGKKATVAPKTKLVSGMLTYDSGNVQSFRGIPTYNEGAANPRGSINMLPVMGDDGRVYMVPEGDMMDKNDMSRFTGLVTRPTLTTVGGAPALVAERGPEMIIGRETTRQMQMYRPDLFRQILEFDRNRSRGFAKTFDEGNVADMQADNLAQQPDGLNAGMTEETAQLLAAAIGALYQQLQQPIRAELNTNGKGNATDKIAQSMLHSLSVGDLESVKRLFGRK